MLPLLPPNLSRIFMAAHKWQGGQEQLVGSCGKPSTQAHTLPEFSWHGCDTHGPGWARAIGSSESGHCIAVQRPLDHGASQQNKSLARHHDRS